MTRTARSGRRVYLALGDSMSIDAYTGVVGGGAARQFHTRLGSEWELIDWSRDGCRMKEVPTAHRGDLITLTVGGNDLLGNFTRAMSDGLDEFAAQHLRLLRALRDTNPNSSILIGNIYQPDSAVLRQYEHLLEEANARIQKNVNFIAATLVDIHAAFLGREAELLTLEIEPNLAGATAIAGLFEAAWQGS